MDKLISPSFCPLKWKAEEIWNNWDTAVIDEPPNSENNIFKSLGDLKIWFLSPVIPVLLAYCFIFHLAELFSASCWFADLSTVSVDTWALQTGFSLLGFVLSLLLLMARCSCGSQVDWLTPGSTGSTPTPGHMALPPTGDGREKIIQIPLSLLAGLHMVCSFVSGCSPRWTRKQPSGSWITKQISWTKEDLYSLLWNTEWALYELGTPAFKIQFVSSPKLHFSLLLPISHLSPRHWWLLFFLPCLHNSMSQISHLQLVCSILCLTPCWPPPVSYCPALTLGPGWISSGPQWKQIGVGVSPHQGGRHCHVLLGPPSLSADLSSVCVTICRLHGT